jgi:hypothetical protein
MNMNICINFGTNIGFMNIVCINFQGGNHCYNESVYRLLIRMYLYAFMATLFMRFSCYNKLQ